MPKEDSSAPSRLGAAGAVAKVADLRDIRLGGVSAECFASRDEIVSGECSLTTSTSSSHQLDGDSGTLNVSVETQIRLHRAGSDPNSTDDQFLAVALQYHLDYVLSALPPEESREEFITAFAEVNGPYNAWPYIREIFQTTVSRMGLPALILPLYRVGSEDSKSDQAGEEDAPRLRVVG